MRLPRMTTRRWMIAVAVVGLLLGGILGGIRLKQRQNYFLSRARYHSAMETASRRIWDNFQEQMMGRDQQIVDLTDIELDSADLERLHGEDFVRLDQLIPYHAAMARKYELAARSPWLPIEPDAHRPGP